MTSTSTIQPASILHERVTCWRIRPASRASLLVDGSTYFPAMRSAMERAEHSILLVGWDFDPRVPLEPEAGDGRHQKRFRDLLAQLLAQKPNLRIHVLIWKMSLVYSIQRRDSPRGAARWLPPDSRLEYRLDDHHPPGAAHHQKVLVVDDAIAFCGGSDFTRNRWDTPQHLPDDGRRRTLDGTIYSPRHDVMLAVDGPAAAALGDLVRERWHRATGVRLRRPASGADPWPEDLTPDMTDVRLGIARTEPSGLDGAAVREIEALYLAAIASAQRWIYLENQYATSPLVGRALAKRLSEVAGPEVVIVCPAHSGGRFDRLAMDHARNHMFHMLHGADRFGRFRAFAPMAAANLPITIHSKVMICDDRILRVGSANLNNRSFGLDSECDLAIEAQSDDLRQRKRILLLLSRLVSEHVDSSVEAFADELDRSKSLVSAIDTLNPERGHRLSPFRMEQLGKLDRLMGRLHLFDPLGGDDNWRPWRRIQE